MTQISSNDITDLLPDLTRLAFYLAPDPTQAEDAVQDVLLALCKAQHSESDIDCLPAYAKTALRRRLFRKRTVTQQSIEEPQNTIPDALDLLIGTDLLHALERLPDNQKELLREYAFDGLSCKKLAIRHSLPLGTVLSRISRARTALKAELEISENYIPRQTDRSRHMR
ncbi:MAG: sigma-70 family RNA polymerase sigma factor [Pseudoruegeria sp.]